MVRNTTIVLVAAFVLVTIAAGISQDRTPEPSALQAELGAELYNDLGLHKLSDDEAARLYEMWQRGPADSYLEITARRYIEEAGWRPVLVIGAVPQREDPDEWLLYVREGYEVISMEPFGSHDDLPMPGWHWAKSVLSSWNIMLPDSKVVHFSAL